MNKVKNYARFYSLLKQMPGDKEELKKMLIKQFARKESTSLKDITSQEYDAMCESMQSTLGGSMLANDHKMMLKKHRSNVLSRLQKLGIDTTDWDCVDAYCLHPRITGKRFAQLTLDELKGLIPKLEIIARKAQEKEDDADQQQRESSTKESLTPEALSYITKNAAGQLPN